MAIAWPFFPNLNLLKTVWRWPRCHSRDRYATLKIGMLKKELLRKEVEEKIRRNYPQDNLFNSFVLGNRVKKRIKGHSHVDLNKTE